MPVLWRQKIKSQNGQGPARESFHPAETKPGAYVIPEPDVPKTADGEPVSRAQESSRYDGDTAIRLYLREIGQVKLLQPDEEIQLAARIKKGDKKAREHMIKANLRLVVKIARDYEGIGPATAGFDQRRQYRIDEGRRAF